MIRMYICVYAYVIVRNGHWCRYDPYSLTNRLDSILLVCLTLCAETVGVTTTPTDVEGYSAPGEIVVYTVTTTNDGTATLRNISLDSSEVSWPLPIFRLSSHFVVHKGCLGYLDCVL